MRKILLFFIPLVALAGIIKAQTNLAATFVFPGVSSCSLTGNQSVSVGVFNSFTSTNLSNVPFNISYTINNGPPVTEVANFPTLGPSQSAVYTFTTLANLSSPGVYNFVAYISGIPGDADQTNDTTIVSVTNTSSVGGVVTSDDTVCQGINSATLNLSGHTGSVVRWESSPNGTTWTNIGNAGSTSYVYNNLADTTYYRVIVKNGSCSIDSSAYAKITVTPIPFLSSSLSTGVCSGSIFNYIPLGTVPGSTFTWSRDSVNHITPVSSSGTGIINEVLSSDTSIAVYTFYDVVTTANGCTNSGETVIVRVDSTTPGPAGTITGVTPVCQNTFNFSYSIAALDPDTTAWYTWSYTGLGVTRFSGGPATPFPAGNSTGLFFSPSASSGDLTVTGTNYCGSGPPSPLYPIAVDTAALVVAGGPDSACQAAVPLPMLLTGASVGGPAAIVGTWSIISGGGSLNTVTATNMPDTVMYTPAAGYAGPVILRLLTNDPVGVCGPVFSDRNISIDTAAIAIAGGPDNFCQSPVATPLTLSGSSVGGPFGTTGTWSILSGGGTLGTVTATTMPDTVIYTPVANYADTIVLQLTTNDPGTACGVVVATRTIIIDSFAIVSAGIDSTICAGNTYALSGTMGGGVTAVTWTTLGDGTFSDSSLVNAVYTPGVADTANGTVTLVITTDDPAGPCTFVTDTMILTIDPAPIVNAGADDTICGGNTYTLAGSIGGSATNSTWTTSGDGTFNDSSLVNAIYTPGVTDTANGNVFLILTTNDPTGICAAAFDTVQLTINPPATVSAGVDTAICAGSTYTLAGTRTGGASASTWTTTGDGTFSDSSLVNAVYTPGATDVTNGNVTLIITSNDPAGPCPVLVDSMVLTIDPIPTAAAGADDSICADGAYTLAGTIGGSATALTWTTSGDGTFNDSSLVNAVYTPGVADSTAGTVFLIITTDDPAGACTPAIDSMVLLIRPPAVVSAGADNTICSGTSYTLAGSRSGGASASTWTSGGDGTFSDSSLVNAVYTPGATDISNGTVTLFITSNDPLGPCTAAVDSMVLTINPAAVVNAGMDDTICTGGAYTLSGMIGGGATSSTWTTAGDGTFNNSSLVNAVYTPGSGDVAATDVYLILTTNDPAGVCGATFDSVLLTIALPPVIVITDPTAVCQPATVNLTLPAVTAGSTPGLTFNYYTDAAATIPVADSTAVTATGTYYIVGTTALGCADTAAVNVVVNLSAVGGIASPDALVCSGNNGDTVELTNYVGAIQKWQYSADGGMNWIDIVNTTPLQPYSNITVTTWYRAMLTATCASAVSEEARITVDPNSLSIGGTVTANDTVCSGANNDTLFLSGHLGTILRWEYSTDGGNTWVYINNTSTSHIYSNLTTTTIFHAVVQNSVCGPAVSSNDTITVTSVSDAGFIAGATPGCPNETSGILVLNGHSGTVLGWQFSVDGGASWTDTLNLNDSLAYTNLSDTTIYRAVVQNQGCTADTTSSAAVIVYPKPLASFTADTVCQGNATTFTNASSVAAGAIQFNQWDFGDNTTSLIANPQHTYPALGTYTVNLVVISNFGCQDTATVNVITDTLPNALITASGAMSFCCGGSVSLSGMPGLTYLWSASAATTQSITVNDCSGSGNYQLTVTDPLSTCSNTASVAVVIFPLPPVDAGNDTAINNGGAVVLNGQGAIVYSWTPVTDLTNPGIANPVATPNATTSYVLTGTDLNGCVNADTITITVIANLNNIIITNLLTTNGDGFNDFWTISDLESYPGTEVIVVNREGQQVYYSSSYNNTWNGTNQNGKALPDGTYYYFIKFPGTDKVYKGPITILNEK